MITYEEYGADYSSPGPCYPLSVLWSHKGISCKHVDFWNILNLSFESSCIPINETIHHQYKIHSQKYHHYCQLHKFVITYISELAFCDEFQLTAESLKFCKGWIWVFYRLTSMQFKHLCFSTGQQITFHSFKYVLNVFFRSSLHWCPVIH